MCVWHRRDVPQTADGTESTGLRAHSRACFALEFGKCPHRRLGATFEKDQKSSLRIFSRVPYNGWGGVDPKYNNQNGIFLGH